MRKVYLGAAGAVLLLGGCSAQQAANFVSGAQTVCKDEATGTAIVAAGGVTLPTTAQKIANACAAINALPAGSFAPAPTP
jgi:uncharacterized protein YcfL